MADCFVVRRGGGGVKPQLIVSAPAGSVIIANNGKKTVTGMIGAEGTLTLDLPAFGTWTVTATLDGKEKTETITIEQEYPVKLSYYKPPEYDYDGDEELNYDSETGNWEIKFLTSGTFTPLSDYVIDVFCAGAGGGSARTGAGTSAASGGGGYTQTIKKVSVVKITPYTIEIGSGGSGGVISSNSSGGKGGSSSGFDCTAGGGYGGSFTTDDGGNGGSGGNGYCTNYPSAVDGADGYGNFSSTYAPGRGQGTTTRSFGDPDGELYCSGGATDESACAGADNTGNGGGYRGSAEHAGNKGGSGIVIIRNARD